MPPPPPLPLLPERMPPRPAPPTTLWETEEDSSPSSPSDHPTDLKQQVCIAYSWHICDFRGHHCSLQTASDVVYDMTSEPNCMTSISAATAAAFWRHGGDGPLVPDVRPAHPGEHDEHDVLRQVRAPAHAPQELCAPQQRLAQPEQGGNSTA